jgi:xanthine dehydrogenase iron-sulfur cluster and FAD-binding subunit A
VNASPIADMIPVLMALDAEVVIYGPAGPKTIELKDFYLGYKKINLSKDEIVIQLKFGIPNYKNHKVQNYKVSQRRDLDISTLNASFNFCLQGARIQSARIVYGGVAATVIRLIAIEKQIEGQDISSPLIADFKKRISGALQPLSDLRGSAEYRKLVAANLFEKFMNEIMEELSESEISNSETLGMRP